MDIMNIVYLCLLGLSVVCSVLSTIFAKKAKKKKIEVQSSGQTDGKTDDFVSTLEFTLGCMQTAEDTFRAVSDLIKTGSMKKVQVMNTLQAEFNKNSQQFDYSLWDGLVDKLISFSKSINGKSDVCAEAVEVSKSTDNIKI